MKEQTVTDKDGNLYVAKPATSYCTGCAFFDRYKEYSACTAPKETYCTGIIYEKATPEDVKERSTFDKATLWLLGISAAYIGAVVWFVWHTATKYSN